MPAPFRTHEVLNQPPPLEDYNVFLADRALQEGLEREGGAAAREDIIAMGAEAGSRRMIELGDLANRHLPELKAFDRFGHRIDEVEFHPAYHELMAHAKRRRLHSRPWVDPGQGSHVARAAAYICRHQIEEGVSCPITMTFAAVPTLRLQPEIAKAWLPRLMSEAYDPAARPAKGKAGATIGMAMTEKQGGSDVRANTTRATPLGRKGPGETYSLVGHKWFCSAPMCDAFLVLAYTEVGLSCFLLPRWRDDGERNGFHVQRLKDKLGNRSNASSEVEFAGAHAVMIGEDGRGVANILEMVRHTRLDCCLGSTATMRQALVQAVHHVRHRSAFQRRLIDQPLMLRVIADMALEVEAATVFALRLARWFDEGADDRARRLARMMTAVGKYWICKRAIPVVAEALECHGGGGYVEESVLSRLHRDVLVNSVWEGSGNVQCLDLLRALSRDAETIGLYFDELGTARGADRRYDAFVDRLKTDLADPEDVEGRSRILVERMALAQQAALLLRHAPAYVADAFVASRLAGDRGAEFGTLPSRLDHRAIADRAFAPN